MDEATAICPAWWVKYNDFANAISSPFSISSAAAPRAYSIICHVATVRE